MKKMPVGVTIISVLYYIVAISWMMGGFVFLVFGRNLSFNSLSETLPILELLGASLSAILGLVLILLGLFVFFVGRGLWKGRNWAKIVAIIFSVIIIILGILSMVYRNIKPLGSVIINIAIGAYLVFSRRIKKSFS